MSNDTYFTRINETLDTLKQEGGGKRVERIKTRLEEAGFTKRLVNRYSLITDEMLSDYHENEFIAGIIKNYARRFSYNVDIETTLRQLNVSARKARIVQTLFEPLQGTSYTNRQLIDMAIEYLFGLSFREVSSEKATHYIQPENVGTWFIHEETGKYVYNYPGRCIPSIAKNIHDIITIGNRSSDIQGGSKYYYHTTDWEGASSILEGINHEAGRKCLDFGWRPSFYIGPGLKNAIEWAEKRSALTKHETALIIFSIPNELPSELRWKDLVGDEWISVVKKSRECKEIIYNEMMELRRIDLVYGPMVSNAEGVAYNNEKPRMHRPVKYQLASKTEAGDNYLYENMVGVIFFQKTL